MINLTNLKILALALTLFSLQSAHAFEKCWYQHLGFRSGEAFTTSFEGQYLGDFQSVYFPTGNILAHWDDALDLAYEISGTVDQVAGVCLIEAKVIQRSSNTIIGRDSFDPGVGCSQGFHMTGQTLFPEAVITPQLKNRLGNKGEVFTGVQYGCQPI